METLDHYIALLSQWGAIVIAGASFAYAALSWFANNFIVIWIDPDCHPGFWGFLKKVLDSLQVISISHPGLKYSIKEDIREAKTCQ